MRLEDITKFSQANLWSIFKIYINWYSHNKKRTEASSENWTIIFREGNEVGTKEESAPHEHCSFSQELRHKNKSSVMTGGIRTWNMIQPWERSRSATYDKMDIAKGHCATWNKTEDRHCVSSPSTASLKVTHKQMGWSQPSLLRHKSKGLIGTWSTESKIPNSLLEMCYEATS